MRCIDPATSALTERPTPTARDGELLIRVRAAGVNPADWKRREGAFGTRGRLPAAMGLEAAGVVTPAEQISTETPPPSTKVGWKTLLNTRFRRSTIALWLTWFGVNFAYYGAFIWLPTLLHQNGMTLVKSFQFTLFLTIAQLPGYLAAAILVEVWGRRATLATFLGGSALGAILFGLAPQIAGAVAPGSEAGLYAITLAAGCTLSFFNLGAWGALYAVTPEVYPTSMRASGAGAATAFGRIAAMSAPLLVPLLNGVGGLPVLFAAFGGMFIMAMVASLFLPEHQGDALQEV